MAEESNNIKRISKGLHLDSSPVDQPKDTARFILNGVNETAHGDAGFIATEQSNEVCDTFPAGYIPIGRRYMSDGETSVMLVKSDLTASEIGILDKDHQYTTHVNDLGQDEKLGFHPDYPIDITYRLRRGCERTIYFVDGLNFPRYYDYDKPINFKDDSLAWSPDKFKLFKTSATTPSITKIDIQERGLLKAGSYNFSIQYLDEDLNPTEWLTTSDTIIIYNDTTAKEFSKVRGSTNKINFYQDFGTTNKSIELTLDNLNPLYPFYRVAIIEASNGTGMVNNVYFSEEISTDIDVYVYSGETQLAKGTEDEIKQMTTVIESARHIEQIENRLILSETKGKQIDFCKLQKYVSKIKSDVVYKEVVLNRLDAPNNQKRGEVHNEAIGYMPGEIYSFGFVYKFADGSLTPVYHIPGKAATETSDMSSDNILSNAFYTDRSTCSDYWGVDSVGNPLTNETNVRHHRFPLRSEVNKPLVTKVSLSLEGDATSTKYLYLNIKNIIYNTFLNTTVIVKVTYEVDDVVQAPFLITLLAGEVIEDKTYLVATINGSFTSIIVTEIVDGAEGLPSESVYGLIYTPQVNDNSSITSDAGYVSEIFGIQFSNIELPSLEDTNGQEIVGYYIVRNERTIENKTIMDSGILTPLLTEKIGGKGSDKFTSHGHLLPKSTTRIKDDTFALIHPEFKFRGQEYKSITKIIKEGEYTVGTRNYSTLVTQDVMPGTSYDPDVSKRREKDSDGFSLRNFVRDNPVTYSITQPEVLAIDSEINEIFYLDTLFSKTIDDSYDERKEIYNLSADNRIGIVSLNKTLSITDAQTKIPYVTLKRELANPYGGFRVLPFFKENNNMFTFDSTTSEEIFHGDSYISPMKYVSSMFYDAKLRKRGTKSGWFNVVIGALIVIAAVVVTVLSLGTSAPITLSTAAAGLTIAAAGLGITQLSTGFKKEQMGKVYSDLYDQGLKETVEDDDTTGVFYDGNESNIPDDEVQWLQDSLSDLWFESSVNMNWRMGTTSGLTDFMDPLSGFTSNTFATYALDKVTILDAEADGGRNYQGYCKAEIYEVNEDYRRTNKQKVFFHLGLAYDCCSNCNEDFPHRTHYSEQSFQEELTDNYRVFLPNNYRDLEGETGKITDLFRIQNNLYIHTTEALWHLPQNFQERVTGDIVSFIGTGDFFAVPPRRIVDDETGHSGGCQHKWATIKTPSGVFFISESQKTIFKFDGQKLEAISGKGLYSWFKNNLKLNTPGNEPSVGTGFISVYDSRYERVIFTKQDKITGNKNKSWTISYSLKDNYWISWHSYLPSFYINTPNDFYSWNKGSANILKHNKPNSYLNFSGAIHPHIVEYVSLSSPLITKIVDSVRLQTNAEKYDAPSEQFVEQRFVTFNKIVAYNSRQCSGELLLETKDTKANPHNYLKQQILDTHGSIVIDRNEKDWTLNDLRDIRIDYSKPIWKSDIDSLVPKYYIDKVLNTETMSVNKHWAQLESFRDKYLIIRLIFDNFDNVKLITNYTAESESPSLR